jgi:ornithine decarboxylase
MKTDFLTFVERKIDGRLSTENDDSFYIFDVEDVRMKCRKWIEKMPKVKPFYAVKCNDDENVLKALVEMGIGFDCASKKEISRILGFGVEPERIVYANTVKQVSHVKFAAEKNVRKVTFDSPGELMKIKKFHPKAEVVLRIRFDAENSLVNLGLKFGCDPVTEAPELIKLCKDMNMNLIGISFHVGSGNKDYNIFERALRAIRELFDFAATEGIKLYFVDIGGGFLGNNIKLLDNYAESINKGIEKYFNDPSIQIISEPGRYFVESAFKLAVEVVLKKVDSAGHVHYYINEGIYLSFMMIYLYGDELKFSVIRKSENLIDNEDKLSTVWGSSCNSKDKILENKMMPELNIGDWLVFHDMGHYTFTLATSFNGYEVGEIFDC